MLQTNDDDAIMDVLTIGVLVAAGGLGGALVLLRNRQRQTEPDNANDRKVQPAGHPVGKIRPEPQTRFLENTKPRQYRLLNESEQELYHRLGEAMPNMRIFVQVGVAQLALARGRTEARRLSRMAGRGVDFVICDQDFAVLAAIELAWPSSTGGDHGLAEEEKRQALQSLGIPLIVFRPHELPDTETIGRAIADAIIRRKRLEAEHS